MAAGGDVDVWAQLVVAIGGGGGLAVLITKVAGIIEARRDGRLQHEETAITRWQAIAERAEREQDELERELAWYRHAYALLYTAWRIGPPAGEGDFPPGPPPRNPNQ